MKFSPRHLVGVNLALLALVAYLGASTVSTAIAARLAPPPEVHLKPPPPPISKVPKRPATYYASINTRDIFNPAKPPEDKPVAPPPPVTPLDLKLWGVSVHTQGWSHCIIEDLKSHKQEVYGIGDTVSGAATVKSISWDRVVLDRGGAESVLEIAQPGGGPGKGGGNPAVAVVPAPAPGGDAPAANAAAAGSSNSHIQQVSDNEYHIDRSEVDSQLDNMNQLFTQIRAVPHFDGGKSTGFRLFAIRQGSVFDQLGLRNGDIIQSINGQELSDPARALALFQELRNAGQINVALLRNKQLMNQSFVIK